MRRLVLWEEDVGSLKEGKSYHLLDMVLCRYEQQSIFLTLPEVQRHWWRI